MGNGTFGLSQKFKSKKVGTTIEPISNRDSVLSWLSNEIKTLKNRGNLDTNSYEVSKGKNKGSKIKEIRAWGQEKNGERVFLLKCKNMKVYDSRESAKEGLSLMFEGNTYKDVLTQMEMIHGEFKKLKETDSVFNFWVRVSSKDENDKKVISVKQL